MKLKVVLFLLAFLGACGESLKDEKSGVKNISRDQPIIFDGKQYCVSGNRYVSCD